MPREDLTLWLDLFEEHWVLELASNARRLKVQAGGFVEKGIQASSKEDTADAQRLLSLRRIVTKSNVVAESDRREDDALKEAAADGTRSGSAMPTVEEDGGAPREVSCQTEPESAGDESP